MSHLCFVSESKGLAPFSIFFCKQKLHGESRAQLIDIRKDLEEYFGKLGSIIMDSKIQFSVNVIFRKNRKNKKRQIASPRNSNLDASILPPTPAFDSETGERLPEENLEIQSESSEHSIFLMQNSRIGKNDCLTFYDSGANTHLIDETLAENKKLQRFLENHTDLGIISTLTAESGNLRFNLASRKEGIYYEIRAVRMKNVTTEFGEYGQKEIGKEFISSATEQEKDYILPKLKLWGNPGFISFWVSKIQESNPSCSESCLYVLEFI